MDAELLTILERRLTPYRESTEEPIAEAEALNDRIGASFDSSLNEEEKWDGLT